ncbi:MAG: carbohydrate ABC transporter substrate-binding protein [Vallitaleaceae bacterium]|nr:carbohydrate ABC transporter substrate-binding protein [Vallitaleaceae bacterium]
MKKLIAMAIVASLVLSLAGCAGSKSETTETVTTSAVTVADSTDAATDAPAETVEKKDIKFYGKVIEYTSGPKMTDALIEKLKDKYNIEAIQVDWSNMDKVIRTGVASGTPCDIYNYPPAAMANFKDLAVDLTPYLDADPEWKAQFEPAALEACKVDGKILSIPWESNFTVALANKKMLDDLGIVIPESWTIEEFSVVAKKIQDAGFFPFANATDLGRASWMFRNAIMSTTLSAGTYPQFITGDLSFTGVETTTALEKVKSLYDNKFMYPGDGAVTVKNDEIKAAFYQGKIAIMAEIAAGAKVTADGADFEVVPVPWPSAGKTGAINGGYNGFFIPQNASDIDAAIEVLKAFTSPEIQAIHAADGYIPANKNVEVTDPFVKIIVAQAATLASPEFPSVAELSDYYSNNIMPDLILDGGIDKVTEMLEGFRQVYLSSK